MFLQVLTESRSLQLLFEFQSFPSVHTFNMLVQKLSTITLLLFLYQHDLCLAALKAAVPLYNKATMICEGDSAHLNCAPKTTVICEGGSAHLNCGLGFIMVLKANYGRTDKTTCRSVNPADPLSDTPCYANTSLSTVSARCDGTTSCTVPATNAIFSDPCVGTSKFLDVSYDCIRATRSVICESSVGTIQCGTGVISVHYANYGRRDLVTCPSNSATTADCYSPQTSAVQNSCNGTKSCQLTASDAVFSDPCVNVGKYLEVTYSCK